jgi:hypothetical protein
MVRGFSQILVLYRTLSVVLDSPRHGFNMRNMPFFTRSVQVSGRPVEIMVYQKSKSVWIAYGKHLGKTYEAQRRTEIQAANAWARAVAYQAPHPE